MAKRRRITRTFTDEEKTQDSGKEITVTVTKHDPVGMSDQGTDVEVVETP